MEVDITEFKVYKEVLEMKMCQQYKVLCFILSSFMDGAWLKSHNFLAGIAAQRMALNRSSQLK